MDERQLAESAEHLEAEYMASMFDLAAPAVRDGLGMEYERLGGGVATVMTHDPTGGDWSRVVGTGWSAPFDHGVVDRAVALFLRHDLHRVMFQVSPLVEGRWEELLEAHGFVPDGAWVKFVRDLAPPPLVHTRLEVRPIRSDEADDYTRVYWSAMEPMASVGDPDAPPLATVPHHCLEWTRMQVGHPSWRTFGAFDSGELVAVSSLFIDGSAGELMGAYTLPEHRGRGAQTAMMAARIRAAAAAGCRWVCTETRSSETGQPSSALNNIRRMGFLELYERRNWLAEV